MYLLFLLTACKAPPQAPKDLEELCKYLFANTYTDDDAAAIAGVNNLSAWVDQDDRMIEVFEGYQINNLDESSIANLDGVQREIGDQLAGAASGYESDFDMLSLVYATQVEFWDNVSQDEYAFYDREYEQDPTCLLDRSCIRLSYTVHSQSKMAGLLDVESKYQGQIQWVEGENGWALLQRTWFSEPAKISPDTFGIAVDYQYFMSVLLPIEDNKTRRIAATWIDVEYGVLPVSEDWAKSQIVESMQSQNTEIEEWMTANGAYDPDNYDPTCTGKDCVNSGCNQTKTLPFASWGLFIFALGMVRRSR